LFSRSRLRGSQLQGYVLRVELSRGKHSQEVRPTFLGRDISSLTGRDVRELANVDLRSLPQPRDRERDHRRHHGHRRRGKSLSPSRSRSRSAPRGRRPSNDASATATATAAAAAGGSSALKHALEVLGLERAVWGANRERSLADLREFGKYNCGLQVTGVDLVDDPRDPTKVRPAPPRPRPAPVRTVRFVC
jgi:hypothetical protein